MRRTAVHTIVAIVLPAVVLLTSCATNAPQPPPVAQTAPVTAGTPTAVAAAAPTTAPIAPVATATAAQPTPLPPTAIPTAASGLPFPTATAGLPTQLITDSTLAALQPLRSIGQGRALVVAISPDNTLLVAGTTAGVAFYDLPSLALLRFDASTLAPHDVRFSPDGKLLAVGLPPPNDTGDSSVEVRSVTTDQAVATIAGSLAAWSSDSTLLAVDVWSGDQNRTHLYRADGSPIGAALDGEAGVFSPDGTLIAVSASVNLDAVETRLYRTSDGTAAGRIDGGNPTWSPDSQTLVTVVKSGLALWRVPSIDSLGTLGTAATDQGYPTPTIAFSADGKLLHEVNNFDVRIWDLASGKIAQSYDDALRPQGGSDLGGPTVFSPDGRFLAVFAPPVEGYFYGVRLFKTDGNQLIYTDAASGRIAYSKDNTLAALVSGEGVIQLVDLADGTAHALNVTGYSGIAFSPNGSTLAAVGSEVTLWDVAAGTRQRTLTLAGQLSGLYGISHPQWSPDGKRLGVETSAGSEGTVFNTAFMWDLPGGDVGNTVWERDEFAAAPIISAFSAANGNVASSYESNEVALVSGGSVTTTFTLPMTATALVFNPIGTQLAAGDAGGTVAVYDGAGAKEAKLLESGITNGQITQLAYSSDGKELAAYVTTDQPEDRLLLWHVGEVKPFVSIATYKESKRLVFTSDGQTVATAGPDGVAFYNVRDGKQIARLEGSADDVTIGPGRRLLAVLSGERVVMYGVK